MSEKGIIASSQPNIFSCFLTFFSPQLFDGLFECVKLCMRAGSNAPAHLYCLPARTLFTLHLSFLHLMLLLLRLGRSQFTAVLCACALFVKLFVNKLFSLMRCAAAWLHNALAFAAPSQPAHTYTHTLTQYVFHICVVALCFVDSSASTASFIICDHLPFFAIIILLLNLHLLLSSN